MAVMVATVTAVAAPCHVYGEARPLSRGTAAQGTTSVPLVAPTTGRREAEQLEYLLHGDFRTHAVEVDAGHAGSSVGL